MRRFLVSLAAMAVLLFTVDRAVGFAMARLFRTSASEDEGDRFGRAIAARPGLVITGSSRAMHHYVADSLGAELGTRVYNLGRDGMWGSLYAYGAGSIVLRHARPRTWILDAMPDLYSGTERFDYLSCFLPYAAEEPAAAEIAALRSRWERVRLVSRIYPYNSLLVSLLSPRLGKVVRPRDGYVELEGRMAVDTTAVAAGPGPGAYPRDPLKWKYLVKAIGVLREGGVDVVAVRSPQWVAGEAARAEDRRISAELRRTFDELGVRYLDFSVLDHPELGEAALYRDASHLNGAGALRFTRELAESLQVTR